MDHIDYTDFFKIISVPSVLIREPLHSDGIPADENRGYESAKREKVGAKHPPFESRRSCDHTADASPCAVRIDGSRMALMNTDS
jgi:hypothetical protein